MKVQLAINETEYITNVNAGKMVSVFFPEDCGNNCQFCTTKHLYKENVNVKKTTDMLLRICASDIEEVVFTGGDPLNNISLLSYYLEISKYKKVYINTCFDNNVEGFVDLLKNYPNVLGVNISRHKPNDLRYVDFIQDIKCNVRINIVGYKVEDIPTYIESWGGIKKDLDISFREDYRNVNFSNLHDFQTSTLLYLTEHYKLYSQVYCHVCNKYMFKTDEGLLIRYHRGLPNTRIQIGVITEIQELVLFPDGELCTDWDHTNDGIAEVCKQLNIKM